MREIGSEFWDVPTCNVQHGCFPKEATWYQSGRAALSAILFDISRMRTISRALLPSWCCESMIKPFTEIGAKIDFYSVTADSRNFNIDYPQTTDADIVLIIDYFGFENPSAVPQYDDCVVIRDLTHSIFSKKHNDADYYFGSLRKWAGFYTGGYAYSRNGRLPKAQNTNIEYIALRKLAMEMKRQYIDDKSNNKEYLEVFSKAESLLDNYSDIIDADFEDIERALYFDITNVKEKRRNNALRLFSRLGQYTPFFIGKDDCPLFVPIFISNRDEVKRKLIENSIYCPCHWGVSAYHQLTNEEKNIYDVEISLVCDQRYKEDDMNRICDIIENEAKIC